MRSTPAAPSLQTCAISLRSGITSQGQGGKSFEQDYFNLCR